jgi:hexosaminidase
MDTPAHAGTWSKSPEYKNLSGGCGGLLNPVSNFTFETLKKIYADLFNLFHTEMIHFGGDEVGEGCWSSNPEINSFK